MWTYDCYEKMLAILRDKGYRFSFFGECSGRDVYLRHDIDVSIDFALPFAEHEHDLGATSTYYVMVDTDAYNPLSKRNRDALKQILALGHDIGLHYVLRADDEIASQAAVLSAALGRPVKSFSIHKPASAKRDAFSVRAPGLINAYDPLYFSKEGYISDSNHNFRVGDPIAFLEAFQGPKLQLLTHPVWWTGYAVDAEEKLRRAQVHHTQAFKFYLKSNIGIANSTF